MSDAFRGASCFVRGLSLMWDRKVLPYAVAPIGISMVLFGVLIWLVTGYFGDLVDYLQSHLPDWLQWAEWLLWIFFAATGAAIVFFTFVIVVSIVASPFNSMLADAVEKRMTGQGAPSTPLGKTILRMPTDLFGELKKLVYSLALAIPFLVLFIIPGINLAAPVLWFLFCAWSSAFAFTDYSMSNHGMRLAEIRRTLRARLLLTLGFGSVAFLACMIPFLNILAVPAAVCGGAVLWVEELSKMRNTAPDSPPPAPY